MKIFFISSSKKQKVTAEDSWRVEWYSRDGKHFTDVHQEAEFFLVEQEAKDFKEALEDAFKLIRHTSGTQVTLTKNK